MSSLKQLEDELRASRAHARQLEADIKAVQNAGARVDHSIPLPRRGLDYAFEPHPPADKLHSAGVSFVMRYLAGAGKTLTEAEARNLSANHIDLCALWELSGKRAAEGYNAGVEEAHHAIDALNNLKPKGEPPIYFAEADFDAHGEGKTGDVLEFVRGAVHTIGWHRVGLYQGFYVIEAAAAEHRCKYLMQTYAWSDGKWSNRAQIQQVANGITVLGADCDLDKAVAADFGQFRV